MLTIMLGTAIIFSSCGDDDDATNDSERTEINPYVSQWYNGHEAIDLGLPSGVKWATMNIGAATSSDYGYYISWAETSQSNSGNYGERDNRYYSKGNVPYPFKYTLNDRKFKLDQNDDAAYVNWGNGWRTPSVKDVRELYENSRITFENINGINVYRFTSKINSASIIIPCGGYISYSNYYDKNESMFIMSCELNYNYSSDSFYKEIIYCACFKSSGSALGIGGQSRYCGVNVRPVYGIANTNVVEQTCSRCDGSGICQTCDGTGKCPVCKGNYKSYNSLGYPVTCDYCTHGRCPGCDGNKKCNLCKGTGKH